ncbi:hypothetical protein [Niveibacterium sp.]|uniref:hypothetical protein n=1 Tax=Niveibacterium sp. TaxID=2017444 RepID=UPI0035AF4C25
MPRSIVPLLQAAVVAACLLHQPALAANARGASRSDCAAPLTCAGDMEQIHHPRSGKLILVRSGALFIQYHYNAQGLLDTARASDGRSVRLAYDTRGRVTHMWATTSPDAAPRELRFAYGDSDKPTRIELLGTSVINVRYDAEGEIEEVRSPEGAKMAQGVTQAFQALLALVKPPCPPQ